MKNMSPHTRHLMRRRSRAGVALNVLLFTLALAAFLGAATYAMWRAKRNAHQCVQHLRHIYLALEMYELDHGSLPHMAFFPDDAWLSADSMLVVLDPYGVTGNTGMCPSAHDTVQTYGLSYIWNANLNGKTLHELDANTWLVTELNALSDQVRAPHLGRYTTLYADGRILRSRRKPDDLMEIVPQVL